MIGNESALAPDFESRHTDELYSYSDLKNRLFTIFQFVFVARE